MYNQCRLYFVTITSTGIYKYTAQWQLQDFHVAGETGDFYQYSNVNKYLFHNFVLYGFIGTRSIHVLREVPDKAYGGVL